ncbi:MAG: hypothetical protein U0790_03390 [Isosphaeraceae bacterium]
MLPSVIDFTAFGANVEPAEIAASRPLAAGAPNAAPSRAEVVVTSMEYVSSTWTPLHTNMTGNTT